MASMTQLSQTRGLDEFTTTNIPRTAPPTNARTPHLPSIMVKDLSGTMHGPELDIGTPEIREPVDSDSWGMPSYSHPFSTSNRVSASSYSTQSTPSILHTPSDSLSGGSPLQIINEQPRHLLAGEPRITHAQSNLYDGIDVTAKQQGPRRPSLRGLRQLTMDNISLGSLGAQSLTPTSASASTSHSPITPSSSQSSFQRLLSKVSLGKDSNKDGTSASDSAKRKKRDDASALATFSPI
ncbi:hypothetical protein F5887DRAFT_945252 [Amanita rubescens]|nr:hypothetical protein F5887DRAFT_945252 [Amanita rubescens]